MGFNPNGDTVENMMAAINNWLTSPTGANLPQAEAVVTADGHISINTGDSQYSISILDEATSNAGSTQQDAVIKFSVAGQDANGNVHYDRTFQGFSNFLGLNNFFSANANEAIYDSKVLSQSSNLGVTEKISLNFSIDGDMNMGQITIYPSDSLQDIVNKINNNPDLNENLRASLVPNGNGYMLRINNMSGTQMEINEVPQADGSTTGFIDRIGLSPSNIGLSSSMTVRDEIAVTPALIAGGSPVFNTSSGKYSLNPSANNIANDMGDVFSATLSFAQAGNITSTESTLANYASSFVGTVASQVSNAQSALEYQTQLNTSISTKEAQISGVDIDEELSQLIIYQKSYAASAQTFTAAKEMLDILLGMMA